MDHARPSGDRAGRPAPRLSTVDDARLAVRLDREVVLAPVRLLVREWPGHRGPLVITWPAAMPDPSPLAPRWRVLSLSPRAEVPYQVQAWDILGLLDQFGFAKPVLLGGPPALMVAACFPRAVAGLALVESHALPPGPDLLDCPSDLGALRTRLTCPVLDVPVPVLPAMLAALLDAAC